MEPTSDLVSHIQQVVLQTDINVFSNSPCTGIVTQIGPLDPELRFLGFIFKGRLFEPAFRISTDKEWLPLAKEYRNICESKCIPFIYRKITDCGTCVHPSLFYGSVMNVIHEILGENYES